MTENLVCYKRLPNWTAQTLPEPFRHKHNTRKDVWAKLTILKGKLQFTELTEDNKIVKEHIFTPESSIPFVEPQAWHRVAPLSDDLECFLEFYCEPKNYFANKYNINPSHSEVVETIKTIKPCKTLDLGSGQGRNSLFLSKLGFEVTAVDNNIPALEFLMETSRIENLDIKIGSYDINTAALRNTYDFILSTVVLMFIEEQSIPSVIKNMQEQTNIGGYNLIVAAMSTEDAPCPLPFPFTFKENELKEYYKDWEFIKYNEDFGQLHKTDANGNRFKLRFATMLAKKIK